MSAALKRDAHDPAAVMSTTSGAAAHVQGDAIEIHDRAGRVVVRYDASSGALELEATGDLFLRAPGGRVVVEGEDVTIKGTRRTSVSGEIVELAAGALEVRASRVLERLGEVYRDVQGTIHTSASIVRTLVRGSYDVHARDARIVSEEDSVIDGKHVLLG